MNFPMVLQMVVTWLESRAGGYAVTGGVALASYGHARMTLGLANHFEELLRDL